MKVFARFFRSRLKILLMLSVLFYTQAEAVRVKDVARLQGIQQTQLVGYGLVVGLRGTGDGPSAKFTTQSVLNMLRNMGIEVEEERIRLRNVAAVMITAELPPFVKHGSEVDVKVSSIGDARSLEGGTLILSPLKAADGEIYALAQGALSIGGYNHEDLHVRSAVRKNHSLVGEIPGGAIVQREVLTNEIPREEVRITLARPDFSSAVAMAKALNDKFQDRLAVAEDAATVTATIPQDYWQRIMEFIAEVENVDFEVDAPARVVLNEKTGTVIAGGNISIREVAVAHGSMVIEVQNQEETREEQAVGPAGAMRAQERNRTGNVDVKEKMSEMKVLPATNSVMALAEALNTLGVNPRDIIAIFQAIKKAGALNAELVVM